MMDSGQHLIRNMTQAIKQQLGNLIITNCQDIEWGALKYI